MPLQIAIGRNAEGWEYRSIDGQFILDLDETIAYYHKSSLSALVGVGMYMRCLKTIDDLMLAGF